MIISEEQVLGRVELKTYRKKNEGDAINTPSIGGSATGQEIESLVSEDEFAGASIVGQVSIPL